MQKKSLKIGMNNVKKRQNSVKLITGEKDTRFADAADQALDALEKQGIATGRDLFDSTTAVDVDPIEDTVTTMESQKTPTSWKELAEIEARNRAAEQLANISGASGDTSLMKMMILNNSPIYIDLRVMIMYMFQMRTIHIHQMKSIQMRLEL